MVQFLAVEPLKTNNEAYCMSLGTFLIPMNLIWLGLL